MNQLKSFFTPGRNISLLIFLISMAAGCARTDYTALEESQAFMFSPVRKVGVQVDTSYIEKFPDCTIIMKPEIDPGLEKFRPTLEETLGRYLTRRFARVIDASERTILARRHALDLLHDTDQRALSEYSSCDTFVQTRLIGAGNRYFVVWAQLQIGLEINIVSAQNKKIVWQGRHMTDRSEGGVPTSVIGAIVDSYSSAKFSSDDDIAVSMIGDLVRRISQAIPDTRIVDSTLVNTK